MINHWTAFQAALLGFVHSFFQIQPVGSDVLGAGLDYFWALSLEPGWLLLWNFFLSLVIFGVLRHEMASLLAQFLQVIMDRRKSGTFDENLLVMLVVGFLPSFFGDFFGYSSWLRAQLDLRFLFLGTAFLIWGLFHFAWIRSKQTKRMIDWNFTEATFFGVFQFIFALMPGSSWVLSGLVFAFLRNFSWQGSIRFILLSYGFYLFTKSIFGFVQNGFWTIPTDDLLAFSVGSIVVFGVGALTVISLVYKEKSSNLFWIHLLRVILAITYIALIYGAFSTMSLSSLPTLKNGTLLAGT